MIDYKKVINANESDFKDAVGLTDFINNYIDAEGDNIANLEDDLHEQADGLVPIYYHDIIEEWQNSNAECKGMAGEQGLIEGETDAYKIMQADLYAYYYQNLSEDYQKFLELLDDQEDDESAQADDMKLDAMREAGLPDDEAERMLEDIKE